MPLSKIKPNSANLTGTFVQTAGDTITGNLRIGANPNGTSANTSKLMIFDDSNTGDGRYVTSYLPASGTYNPSNNQSTDKIVSGMRYGWYGEHYTMGPIRGDGSDTVGFALGRSDLGFVNMMVGQGGLYMRSGVPGGQQSFYRRWYVFGSAFDNPTINLLTVTGGNTNNEVCARVRVRQIPYTGSADFVHNEHLGLGIAWRGASTYSTSQTSMSLVSGLTGPGGTNNVGTLSWSGTSPSTGATLRYTSNRASNYDSYYVEVEVVQNNGGNFAINMYP
jgi:hypothetical protein